MTPKQFLLFGGAILFVIGILGYVGVIGPTLDKSIFHSFWWFDDSENIGDTLLGMTGVFTAFAFPAIWQKYLVIIYGILGSFLGVYSLLSTTPVLGANFQNPPDTMFHLAFGAWAFYSVFVGGKTSATRLASESEVNE